jgi:hypothetical protein
MAKTLEAFILEAYNQVNLDFLRYGVRTPQPIRNDNLDLRLANFHSSSSLAPCL